MIVSFDVGIHYGIMWYDGSRGRLDPPGPLFTKRMDVSPQDIVKSRSREIRCYDDRIALKLLPKCVWNLRAIGNAKPESRGFETSRDPVVRRPSASFSE